MSDLNRQAAELYGIEGFYFVDDETFDPEHRWDHAGMLFDKLMEVIRPQSFELEFKDGSYEPYKMTILLPPPYSNDEVNYHIGGGHSDTIKGAITSAFVMAMKHR